MIDTQGFIKRFTEALLHMAADHNGVGDVEAYRRYQTDALFHTQIDALVLMAVQCIHGTEQTTTDYAAPFWDEANSLLGWNRDD